MAEFVGMTKRTARGVADLLRADEERAPIGTGQPQTQHRSQIVGGIQAAKTNAVVVRGIPVGGEYGTVLQVQRITLTDDGWAATGETIEMPTFPLAPAIFWQKFIVPEGSVPEMVGDIQPTVMIDGVECVGLFIPFFPITVRSDEPHRGPRPI